MVGVAPSPPALGPFPVVLPNWRDARLAQSVVLLSLQVLGQTTLGFAVSVPQIAVSLATCAVLDVLITLRRRRVLMWPASALLTGNGVALILRDPGTVPGDHWSTDRLGLFAGVAALSLLSKYALRFDGRHVFNPSNVGLVAALVVLGAGRADAQLLYWGPWRPGLAAAVVLIVGGAAVVGRRAGVWDVALLSFAALAASLGTLAASGHCIVADWSSAPLCDGAYWWRVAFSPETLVFAAFMVTDPRTVPSSARGRRRFAVATGVIGGLLAAPQQTEFATKVAILAGLVVATAGYGLVRLLTRSPGTDDGHATARWFAAPRPAPAGRLTAGLLNAGVAAAAVGLLAGAIVIAGGGARTLVVAERAVEPSGAGQPGGGPVDAERTPWPAGVRPPVVEVADDVDDWAPWFRPSDAEERARAVVGELERRRLAAGEPPVTYQRVQALMVRVPDSVQESPEVGLAVTVRLADGREHTDWYRTTSAGASHVIAGSGEPWTDPVGA